MIVTALGSPVVPLLKSLAAVVPWDAFRVLNRTQSSSPTSNSLFHDRIPWGIDCPRLSKTQTFPPGTSVCFAALRRESKISGSEIRNLLSEALI